MADIEYARSRIYVLRAEIRQLSMQIDQRRREISKHELTLLGDPEPGYEWCSCCRGRGIVSERQTCYACDGEGQISIE